MNLTTFLNRSAMLVAVAPFVAMLFQASHEWLAAYAQQNLPITPAHRTEEVLIPSTAELMSADRTMMKQEAVNDLINGVDQLEQTLERFRAIESSHLPIAPLTRSSASDRFEDELFKQVLCYFHSSTYNKPNVRTLVDLENLKCEFVILNRQTH